MQIIFLPGTKCLWLPQYVNKFLVWHKKFGPSQNILGPVNGQCISPCSYPLPCLYMFQKLVHIFCVLLKIYSYIVQVTNILCQAKRWFAFSKIGFCAGTKGFEEALNAVKFWGWLKKFGQAQNIFRPVKGQGISLWPIKLNRHLT